MANDWYDIKFLESATNVRELIRRSTGRAPRAAVAREISVCIQQGRLFFEAAGAAPIQIKPLQIYYGIVAFAQAVVIATRNVSLSTLVRRHGLTDITPAGAGVENLALRFESAGTFQEFNDAIAALGRVWYFDNYMPRWFEKPFSLSSGLSGQSITIKDVLSRMPGLADKYQKTFGSPAASAPIILDFGAPNVGRCTLRIDDPDLYTDRASLIATVRKWRTAYPFLERWRFVEALHAWGSSVLIFDNAGEVGDDLSDTYLVEANNNGFTAARLLMNSTRCYVSAPDILPPLAGGYDRSSAVWAMQPIAGLLLPEHSLEVLGGFMLSSLVRYRPQIWQNAISRSTTADSRADDRSLSLIEAFLDIVLNSFPNMVVHVIDYNRVV